MFQIHLLASIFMYM